MKRRWEIPIGFQFARIENVLTDEAIPAMPDGSYNFSRFFRSPAAGSERLFSDPGI